MKITATRLGSSPITLDWTGIPPISIPEKTHSPFSLQNTFYDCPHDLNLSQELSSNQLAQELLSQKEWTDCLFLGIGGSSLGPNSLLSSLREQRQNNLHFHFMDNPDPIAWNTTLAPLNPDTTLVCITSKSGNTFETLAEALLALQWLTPARWKDHCILITDPDSGDLRHFANQYHLRSLPIPPSIGGRFSLFTSVGLFPIALGGLSTTQFLKGAQQVRDYLEKTPLSKNALIHLAQLLIQHAKHYPIHIFMPYTTRLEPIGPWFNQLWAESLGKQGKGFTPLSALGPRDQHSLLQLLLEGPQDKMMTFLILDQFQKTSQVIKMPSLFSIQALRNFSTFPLVEQQTLQNLLTIEYECTATTLAKQNKPYWTLRLDHLSEQSLGALYFTLASLTAYTGFLWDINPFDQPGVEDNKHLIQERLQKDRFQG